MVLKSLARNVWYSIKPVDPADPARHEVMFSLNVRVTVTATGLTDFAASSDKSDTLIDLQMHRRHPLVQLRLIMDLFEA